MMRSSPSGRSIEEAARITRAEDVFGSLDPGAFSSQLAVVAYAAAAAAAQLLAETAGRSLHQVELKSSATDMVSEVDRAAESLIATTITELRPDDGILGEEGADVVGTSGVRWVVDPLDGTTNFVFGIPQYSVSIAAELHGEAVVGIVIDPSRDETWAAVRGAGARCNGARCQVASGRSTLSTALVATGFGYRSERRLWQAATVAAVIPAVRDIRRFGSAALDLCWVAGGRVDAYYEWGLNPWDLAAGRLICEEAGGRVELLEGHTVVATTPELAEPLAELLRGAGALNPPRGVEPRHW